MKYIYNDVSHLLLPTQSYLLTFFPSILIKCIWTSNLTTLYSFWKAVNYLILHLLHPRIHIKLLDSFILYLTTELSWLNSMTILYSLSTTFEIERWQVKIKLFNSSQIMAFIDTLPYQLQKVKGVAFRHAHFHVLFISFLLGYIIFLSPLNFLLGLFTLFLIFFSFLQNMGI